MDKKEKDLKRAEHENQKLESETKSLLEKNHGLENKDRHNNDTVTKVTEMNTKLQKEKEEKENTVKNFRAKIKELENKLEGICKEKNEKDEKVRYIQF